MRIDTSKMTIAEIVAQKKTLIAAKKQLPIWSEPINFATTAKRKPTTINKQETEEAEIDPGVLPVTLIGNTCLWCDSHMDVLAIGAFDQTIKQKGNQIPHLRDHKHDLTGKIGKTKKVYTEMFSVSDFGIESDVKETQSLLMDSDVIKKWDEKVFEMYKDGDVDQHSIGLQYVRIELAVDDEDFKEEFAVWEKAFPQVINKEKVAKRGYFWWVTEIKLFEISAVLFGSNELTPTLSNGDNKSISAPSDDTREKEDSSAADEGTLEEEKRKRNLLLTNY